VLRDTSSAFGWDAQRKKSETYTQRSEMMLRSVRSGLNAWVWASSWSTMIHKTKRRLKGRTLRNQMKGKGSGRKDLNLRPPGPEPESRKI